MWLSKSRYCRGIQCPKMLWLDDNRPDLAEDVVSQNIVETGIEVGKIARAYFGEYILVDFSSEKNNMVESTKHIMASGEKNIAEASFLYESLYCAVDILHKTPNGWDIVEVKSSTEIHDIFFDDMAFQYYVLSKCGIVVNRVYNLHIDNSYTRHGEINISELFVLEDCTDEVIQRSYEIEERIEAIKEYNNVNTEPYQDIDCYCDKPYECAYKKYCFRYVPKKSVFDLARMQSKKKYELYHEGIITYNQILEHCDKINTNQKRQIESIVCEKPDEYDMDKISEFLDTLTYPIYHLDFETFQQAIPQFDGCHPYEQIPFQYSLHIEYEDGRLEHKEYLAKEGEDPRKDLAERLIADIPQNACVTAYNMSFEKTVIKHLAQEYKDLTAHLMNIHDNIHDLMIPFQKQYYYSKAMQGSYSIKYVLPALWPNDPELDYHNLDGVHNGSEASYAFSDMVNHAPNEIADIRNNLLKYCGLDTYAMVKVHRKLRDVVNNE